MKEIKFIYGQENGLVVEKQQKDDSIFFEQYQQAHHLIQNIEQSMSNDSPNMLAFCGDRGDGKTSCMQSVLEQVKYEKVKVGEAELNKYVLMKMIDPAFLIRAIILLIWLWDLCITVLRNTRSKIQKRLRITIKAKTSR